LRVWTGYTWLRKGSGVLRDCMYVEKDFIAACYVEIINPFGRFMTILRRLF